MEAVALHSFKPTEPDELRFEKGNILHILEMEEDPNWYKARLGQREGMVPANHITLQLHPWYVSRCSRREAEARLLETDAQANTYVQPDGAFILRQSENEHGQFSISVKEGSSILHFRVFSDASGKYHIWNNKFQSVNELIDYHRYQTIYGDKTLLLRDCVPSKFFGPVGSGPNAVLNDSRQMHINTAYPTDATRSTTPADSKLSATITNPTAAAAPASTLSHTPLPPGVSVTNLTGRHCVARFDFSAEFEGEMSFRRGDRMNVLGAEDDNWWFAESVRSTTQGDYSHTSSSSTQRGLIPANYVELIPQAPSSGGRSTGSRGAYP